MAAEAVSARLDRAGTKRAVLALSPGVQKDGIHRLSYRHCGRVAPQSLAGELLSQDGVQMLPCRGNVLFAKGIPLACNRQGRCQYHDVKRSRLDCAPVLPQMCLANHHVIEDGHDSGGSKTVDQEGRIPSPQQDLRLASLSTLVVGRCPLATIMSAKTSSSTSAASANRCAIA